MQVILNIGLDGVPVHGESYTNGVRNPNKIERLFAAVGAVRDAGFKVRATKLIQSDSELTLVVAFADNGPGLDNRIAMLSAALDQDCIAAYYPDEQWGQLIGPKAAAWGQFNPEFFFLPDGSRLSATSTK
jgi:hypothetical protein